jgi:adenosylcobinamide-phosphate synthase
MGWIITSTTEFVLELTGKKVWRRLAGVIIGSGLILGSGISGWLGVYLGYRINFYLGISLEVILLASCFAGRSLRAAAENVLQPLAREEIVTARTQLSLYVGRDTGQLTGAEILRAVLETVAENSIDGVTSPLFYALIGTFLPAIGPVPLTLAYKAAGTLDSMIGYRREPYTDIGWFPAQLEDRLTWLPCRLTVLTLALISGMPRQVFSLCVRDAHQDPSPNSGWSESVYAAILGVQLGGTNIYKGIPVEKPLLGEPNSAIANEKIYQALRLTRCCFLIWLAVGISFSLALDFLL